MPALCEQYIGDDPKYSGTWIRRGEASFPLRTELASEWRRDRKYFKKVVVVHGKTSFWRRKPGATDQSSRWLVTLADTCPYPRR